MNLQTARVTKTGGVLLEMDATKDARWLVDAVKEVVGEEGIIFLYYVNSR